MDELKRVLTNLAAPAADQIRYLNSLTCTGHFASVDELALEYEDCIIVFFEGVRAGELSMPVISECKKLDNYLESMSGTKNAPLWEEDALSARPEWETVREMARNILKSLS